MFFISTPTFNSWRAQGKWGDPIGNVPNRSGMGKPLLAYSMEYVLEVYERELPYIAARAISRGVKAEEFENALDKFEFPEVTALKEHRIVWGTVVDGKIEFLEMPEYTDDSPYYDGLPI